MPNTKLPGQILDFINSSLPPALLKTAGGLIVYSNTGMCKLLGEPPDKIIGKNFYESIRHADPALIQKRDLKLIDKGESEEIEICGSHILINSIFAEPPGVYILELAFDVLKYKRMEADYKKNERIHLQLLENCPIGIGIGSLDGRVVYANEPMGKLFGYHGAGFKDAEIKDFYSNPSERREFLAALKSAGKLSAVELELKTKHGATFTSMTDMTLVEIDGETLIFTYHRDITQKKRTQKELVISQERYRLLSENLQEGLCHIDDQAIIMYSNPRMAEIMSCTPDEMTGMNFERFLQPDRRGFFTEKIGRCRSGSMERFEAELLKPDGSSVFVSMAARPLFGMNENYRGMLLMLVDVTDQKIAENILRIKEEHYRTLYETINAGIVYLDENGKILSANPAAEKILGLSSVRLTEAGSSKTHLKAVDEAGNDLDDSQLPGMKALRTGKAVRNRIIGIWNHASDRRVWVSMNAVPVFWPGDSKPWQVYVNFVDITERKEREDELARSELKYQQLVETAYEGYWSLDETGITNYVNKSICEIMGYEKNELLGKTPSIFMDEKNSARFESAFSDCARGRRVRGDWELIHKNGRRVFVKASMSQAFDTKGVSGGVIWLINDYTRERVLENKIRTAKLELFEKYSYNDMIGKSSKMLDIFETIPVIAEADCNVLIDGESGTGKNLIAKIIHNVSARRKKPFITINCGSLPEQLLESELFGYVKGAFTGADRNKSGKFAIAEGGIIFLDEIGEIPLSTQVKLLRIIDEKRFEPVGSNTVETADVRIVAATNKNLISLVNAGKFRSDLYYRLNVVNIKIPPLKQRREDIELLLEFFIRRFNEKYSKNIVTYSEEILRFFMRYDFPGNIRELKNILERAVIFCNDATLRTPHLAPEYKAFCAEPDSPGVSRCETYRNAKSGAAQSERGYISGALECCGGNVSAAARSLCMSKSTLWRKIKLHSLENQVAKSRKRNTHITKSEKDDEAERIQKALNKSENRLAAARLLGIDRTTLWRKMKKYGIE